MYCPNCRQVASDGSQQCARCGQLFTHDTRAASSSAAPLPWSPYPGMNAPTNPPPTSTQAYTPYPERPDPPAQYGDGATWPGNGPAGFTPGVAPTPPNQPPRRSKAQVAIAAVVACVVVAGMLFVWFSTRQAAPPAASATKAAGGLNNRLTVTVSTATSNTETSACGRLSNFIGAGRATVIPMFPEDIPFPPNSVSYLGENLTEGQYSYDLVSVCSNGLSANAARAYFSQSLPRAGWTQSALYPFPRESNARLRRSLLLATKLIPITLHFTRTGPGCQQRRRVHLCAAARHLKLGARLIFDGQRLRAHRVVERDRQTYAAVRALAVLQQCRDRAPYSQRRAVERVRISGPAATGGAIAQVQPPRLERSAVADRRDLAVLAHPGIQTSRSCVRCAEKGSSLAQSATTRFGNSSRRSTASASARRVSNAASDVSGVTTRTSSTFSN